MKVCFERKVDDLESQPIVRVWCKEGGDDCWVAPNDFGWAQNCTPASGQQGRLWQLVRPAHAQSGGQPHELGWAVPSLQTLRRLQEGQAAVAYSEFVLTSGSLPDLREANRLVYAVRVNGAPIYVDGLPPEAYAMPFDASKGLALEFGLENLDFSGKHSGYEDIEVSFQFLQEKRLIKQATALLRYIALREMTETEVQAGDNIAIRWKAAYHPGRRDDVYQIFLHSRGDESAVSALEDHKKRIDHNPKLQIDGRDIVAVMRPPLPKDSTPAYGLILGVQQPTGQVKFTFDDQTSQHLCQQVIELAANSRLINATAYRRNVDDGRDRKSCNRF